eukprot:TRINITY_DN2395_c0_g1_i2.p1 TRINITY_DN2395_c0_g1~~TRINITY_DN2395_c0_g1_i2.p1  ORF type:complete len:332 (+),score=53.73 TRINITY_DN2395_c0_g1_i2:88-1083(+)
MLAMLKENERVGIGTARGTERALGVVDRMTAACVGSTLVALTMTPLDVVKVKVQACSGGVGLGDCVRNPWCKEFYMSNGMMELKQLKSKWPCFKKPPSPCVHSPTLTILKHTIHTEGIRGVYAGFVPTIVMSIPNNVMYFAAYEAGKESGLHPTVSGSMARLLSSSLVAPLEFTRTRIQAGHTISSVQASIHTEGYGVLWRGIVPTLWRDVPFSGLYWGSYESLMYVFNTNFPHALSFFKAFVAGGLSGCVSATFTMPFDVVKTRHQVQSQTAESAPQEGLFSSLRTITQTEGVSALFSGLGPRVARAGPSCAIMISAYEAMKVYLRCHEL